MERGQVQQLIFHSILIPTKDWKNCTTVQCEAWRLKGGWQDWDDDTPQDSEMWVDAVNSACWAGWLPHAQIADLTGCIHKNRHNPKHKFWYVAEKGFHESA